MRRGSRMVQDLTVTSGAVKVGDDLTRVDWHQAKASLTADDFDNGRSAVALRRSFEQSQHVVFAWSDQELIGMARLLSDGVCNAYLLDVWTRSDSRRRGVATAMIRRLMEAVPGQHVGLQTDSAEHLYSELGFRLQPQFMAQVVGTWLSSAPDQ